MGAMEDYYTARKWQLMVSFELAARLARKVIVARCGEALAELIAVEARREYESLIPQLPYIGGRQNTQTQILLSAALFLALYKALRAQDWAVEEIGALVQEAVETTYARIPLSLCRLYGRLGFRESSQRKMRERATASQERRYAGDWVYSVVDGDGQSFDYGLDFEECGIWKFFQRQGAEEFTLYMCQLDYIASDRFGWGLVRTTTIAEDGDKCDFRFRRGR